MENSGHPTPQDPVVKTRKSHRILLEIPENHRKNSVPEYCSHKITGTSRFRAGLSDLDMYFMQKLAIEKFIGQ